MLYETDPTPLWITIGEVAQIAHDLRPDKYGPPNYKQTSERWRKLVKRNDWKGKGWARQVESGLWQVLRSEVVRVIESK